MSLYNYQYDAVKRMKNGCILCGGVGSGKSITSLAYYYTVNGGVFDKEHIAMVDPPLDLYIISTAKKRDNLEWEGELAYFLMSTNEKENTYSNKVVVDSWNNIKKYADVKNSFFIFDEQRLIGSGAWVKTFLKIAKHNQWILLSATPGDTWMDYVPVFLANGFYKNRRDFSNQHIIYKKFIKYPVIDKYVNTGKLLRYRNDILVHMSFERKTTAHHIHIKEDYDIAAYKEISKNRWNDYKNQAIVNASELCYVYRRLVNSQKERQETLIDIFKKHKKLIVFYNFDYELDILTNINYGKNVQVAQWNGHKHQDLPKANSWVYLVQYTAGCEGWNCTSTDAVVFYSQNYSYKVMTQAAGRIDRLNTKYTDLYYYHLKTRAPIDLAIEKALKNKKNFNEKAFVFA